MSSDFDLTADRGKDGWVGLWMTTWEMKGEKGKGEADLEADERESSEERRGA